MEPVFLPLFLQVASLLAIRLGGAAERLAECGLVDPVVDEPVADCGLVDPVVDEAAGGVNAAWSGDSWQTSAWTDEDERVSWQTWYSEELECQT